MKLLDMARTLHLVKLPVFGILAVNQSLYFAIRSAKYGRIVLRGRIYMAKLSLYLATLLLGTNFSATTVPSDPIVAVVAPITVTADEQRLIDLTNAERWDRNLGALSVNPLLVQVARQHSKEMYDKSYFDHKSPTPGLNSPMQRYLKALGRTPTWAYLGENLFYCSVVNVELGHKCLMESTKHRENILNPRFEQIGVGVYEAPDGQFFVTQMFLAQTD